MNNVGMAYDPRCCFKVFSSIMAPGSRPALYDMDFAVSLSSSPGGVYLHTQHRLRDVFFVKVD
jgi:hypothetical protein